MGIHISTFEQTTGFNQELPLRNLPSATIRARCLSHFTMKLSFVFVIVVNALLLAGAGPLKSFSRDLKDEATIEKKVDALTASVNGLTALVEKIVAREHEAAIMMKEMESDVKDLQSGPYPQLRFIGQGRCGGDNMTKIRFDQISFAGCMLSCEGKR